jgi:hypothetical protein
MANHVLYTIEMSFKTLTLSDVPQPSNGLREIVNVRVVISRKNKAPNDVQDPFSLLYICNASTTT